MAQAARSIWSRKRDLAYLTFFMIHIPIIFIADLSPLYPESIKPGFVTSVQNFYITQYKDKFFIDPPTWFQSYTIMELLYHVPLSLWAVGGLINDSPSVPLHLLPWAVQTSVTTWTCLVEMWSWTHISQQEKTVLSQLYAPYLALAVLMGLDMFFRLKKQLHMAEKARPAAWTRGAKERAKDK